MLYIITFISAKKHKNCSSSFPKPIFQSHTVSCHFLHLITFTKKKGTPRNRQVWWLFICGIQILHPKNYVDTKFQAKTTTESVFMLFYGKTIQAHLSSHVKKFREFQGPCCQEPAEFEQKNYRLLKPTDTSLCKISTKSERSA